MGEDGRRKRAEKVVEHLREKANVDELELVRVPDVVKLRLKTARGRVLSRKLSHGQANICVLLLLLLQSTGPIVIDEPELSLDEDYINDVLVPALRVVRKRCQIILISHHATLICLSEPELIHKLADEDGEVLVVRSGALDEMRDVVERMDGGRDAFLLRAKLYGHTVGA
jgi:predicted ATPase